jgi:hypothetical protein
MDANAVLGPVDPQIGDLPAASIVRMVDIKGPANVSDQMLVLADMAQKARIQVAYFVSQILRKHHSQKKSIEIATILSEGRWTHDFPILAVNAKELGLPVTTDMPRRLRPDGPLRAGPGRPSGSTRLSDTSGRGARRAPPAREDDGARIPAWLRRTPTSTTRRRSTSTSSAPSPCCWRS